MIGDEVHRDCIFSVGSGSLCFISVFAEFAASENFGLSNFSQYTVACNESFTFPRDVRRRKYYCLKTFTNNDG